jgi:hypothetical protein
MKVGSGYGVSYRDVEGLLAERAIKVDHVAVYRWVQRLTSLVAYSARFAPRPPAIGGSSTKPTSRSTESGGMCIE